MNSQSNLETILVTGGCGFIGSHIVDSLINIGYQVIVVDNLSSGSMKNLNPSAIFYQGDASNNTFIDKIFGQHQFSYVIHQSVKINTNVLHEKPTVDVDSSIKSTIVLLDNCIKHGIKNFIFASSVAVYGKSNFLPALESSIIDPIYSYGIAKYSAENYIKYYAKNYGINYQILRYCNVYGPRQPIYGEVGVIAIYTERFIKNNPLVIFGSGDHIRDYIFVSDIVDFTLRSMNLNTSNIFNVGRGVPVTVKELFNVFQALSSETIMPIKKPERHGEIGNFYADISNALKTGWTWKVSLKKGIEKTIFSFKDQGGT